MSRISTDSSPDGRRYRRDEGYRIPDRRPDHDFRRAYGIAIGVLVALCLVFLGLTWFQGPKLQDAVIDTSQVTQQDNQQLRLFMNQPVAQVEADRVTITPTTSFTVSVTGDLITVQFDEILRNDTEYVVEIAGVTSAYHDQASTIRHTFTTAEAEALYLDRADPAEGGSDSIIQVNLATGEREEIFSAPRVQRFARDGHVLAVQTLNDDSTNELALVNLVDGVVEPVALPVPGTIGGLQASAGFVAFTFTDAEPREDSDYLSTLVRIDLAGVHDVLPVTGLDGAALEVVGWQILPESSEVLALNSDHSLLRIDLAASAPTVPLGSYDSVGKVSADGAKVIVGTTFDTIELSLLDGSETPVLPPSVNGLEPFAGEAWPLVAANARVQKVTNYDFETNESESFVVFDDGAEPRVLYATGGVEGLEEFSVSPNGQYVAVEVHPSVNGATSDGYYPDDRSTAVVTRIYAAASGALVRELTGFAVDWRRASW